MKERGMDFVFYGCWDFSDETKRFLKCIAKWVCLYLHRKPGLFSAVIWHMGIQKGSNLLWTVSMFFLRHRVDVSPKDRHEASFASFRKLIRTNCFLRHGNVHLFRYNHIDTKALRQCLGVSDSVVEIKHIYLKWLLKRICANSVKIKESHFIMADGR